MLLRLVKDEIKKGNAIRQDIIHSDRCTLTCMKLRINSKDKSDSNIQDVR